MPVYNGNNVYLEIEGLDVGGIFRQFSPNLNTGDENVSHGAGVDWEKHAAKLSNVQATIIIVYDTDRVSNDMTSILDNGKGQVVTVKYCPEGNTAGKPVHEQDFLITSVNGPTTNHDKTLVTYEISCISTGEPTSNMYAGDTVAA